jgi:Ca2+-binding EF-hand superfamily protein
LKRAFDEFDIDKKGYIEGSGIERVLTKLKIEHTSEEIELMVEVADTNGDGKVDLDEFLQIFKNAEEFEG